MGPVEENSSDKPTGRRRSPSGVLGGRRLYHIIWVHGVSTDPPKVNTVRKWPTPSSMPQVRSFFDLASYYRQFMQDFAFIAQPLHQLTEKGLCFHWNEEC